MSGAVPEALRAVLHPVNVVAGHYGAGKTSFCVNLACDLAAAGEDVTVVDLDVVNPYFRATEQRALLEGRGVRLVAPVFAEAGTSLDVPSLTGAVVPAIERAHAATADDRAVRVIVDAGGDDAGATALGRFARFVAAGDYALLYVANRYRNLVADPEDALQNLREVETAARLHATALVNNSHLKQSTTAQDIAKGADYAVELARLAALPLACTTVPEGVRAAVADQYPITPYVTAPWE